MEEGSFKTAWGGISSLAVALPVVWTGMRQRGLGLDALARWMALQPAKLAGLEAQKGAISVGRDADFVMFDEDVETRVRAEALYCRHAVSPYVGEMLCGQVQGTYVRGECVFEDGAFAKTETGRAL